MFSFTAPAKTVIVDGASAVVCPDWISDGNPPTRTEQIPAGEAVELDAEMVEAMDEMSRYRYGGTD